MLTLAHNASRRLTAVLVAALLAVGVLAAAPAASAADATELHFTMVEPVATADTLWGTQLWVSGPEVTGSVRVTLAGRTETAKQDADPRYPHQYEIAWPVKLPKGTYPVTATFVSASGVHTATTSTTLKVYGPLIHPGPRPADWGAGGVSSSQISWAVSPQLRATIAAEGGSVTYAGGAATDPLDTSAARLPVTDYLPRPFTLATGGAVRFRSAARDVTISDITFAETRPYVGSTPGTYAVRADVTYRHPGQATRTERRIVVATSEGVFGEGGDFGFFMGASAPRATPAGARALGVPSGSSLGDLAWDVYLQDTPVAAVARVAVSPASTTYGSAVRVNASVTRGGTYATGTVTFRAGSRALGTVRLSRGAAAVTVPAGIGVGTHAVTASYKADYSPTTAAARASLRITRAGTVTKARLAKKKVTRSQRAKVTATVAGRGTTIRPTGRVTVFDGKKRVAKVVLTASKRGTVTVKLPRLKKRGKHTLRIVYGGSSAFGGSSTRVVLRVR